jgi:hypothetical protein
LIHTLAGFYLFYFFLVVPIIRPGNVGPGGGEKKVLEEDD